MGKRTCRSTVGLLGLCLCFVAITSWAATLAATTPPQETTLLLLLQQPEGSVDLARAKIAIDRLVDPSIDPDATLRLVEEWAAKARARFPANASNKVKMDMLISTLYEPGPWNDHRSFGYDYSDPFGNNVKSTLLSTYLATRKGQCVIMPIAFLIIGQRIGLPLTMTTAPYHLIVKYGDEGSGQWTNFEATSGLFHADSGYERALNIPPEATNNDTFLRPYTQRETVALFATASLVPYYRQKQQAERMLAATDLILKANPKDVIAMTQRGDAYYLLIEQQFKVKHPQANQIPQDQRATYLHYSKQNLLWYTKAEALGWRHWEEADRERYLRHFDSMKLKSQGGS